METDLNTIRVIAKTKKKQNMAFRRFLKLRNAEEIDKLVHTLYQKVASSIDCMVCANCCKELQVLVDIDDIDKLSQALRISVRQFTMRYVTRDAEEPNLWVFKNNPCPFLQHNCCLLYTHRPQRCISYPHLQKEQFTERLLTVLEHYDICPIVFNVCECLKTETGFNSGSRRDIVDYSCLKPPKST